MVAKTEVGRQFGSRLMVGLWSASAAIGSILCVGVALFVIAPQDIDVKMNARGLVDGQRNVAIRAVDSTDSANILYTGTTQAYVAGGILTTKFTPPLKLIGKSYVIEVCTTKSGTKTTTCFDTTSTMSPESALEVKDGDKPLYSCPYYVAEQKSTKLANLTRRNIVEIDNRVNCGDAIVGGTSKGVEFNAASSVASMQYSQPDGIAVAGSGIVVAKDGLLSTIGIDELRSELAVSQQQAVQYVITPSSSNQSLTLVGRTLSLSGGNSVLLPADSDTTYPVANSTTTGLISNTDWSTFAAKENSLVFDNGLLRNGNTVSLMDCAVGQILKNDGASWVCALDAGSSGGAYAAGTGIAISGTDVISNTGVLSVTASGALTSSGGQNPAITLATTSDLTQLGSQLGLTNTGVTPGTYNNVTVDAKGRVTSATNVSYLTSEADAVVGNEVAGVVTNGGLVMTGAGTAGDPYKVGLVTTCADGQLLKYTAIGGWACATDIDTNTDAQTLTWNSGTNILSIGGGNTVDLTSLKDNTDNQALTWNSGTRQLSLTNGGTVTIADNDTTYSNGNGLSLTGTVFAISAPTCTGTTAKLLWSGTAFTCGTDVDTDTTYTAGSGLSLTGTTFALAQQGATTGQVLKWNGTAWVPAADTDTTYTAGTGISITAGSISATLGTDITSAEIVDGTITAADLANSGATAGTYGNTGVNVAQLTVNAQGQVTAVSNRALPTATTTTTGVLSSTDWTTFNGKENVLTFSDGLTRTSNTVTLMDCAANQILQRNSGDTAWVCANQVVDTNTTYSAGTGLSLTGTTFANTGVLSVTASGALTSSGGQNPAITLATTSDLTQLGSQLGLTNTGVTPGTYNNVTVDAKGRVTSATNVSYLTSEADAVVGNEVAGVVTNGGLVMTGAGTAGDPYKVGLVTTCADGQLLKYTAIGGWACATDIDTNTDAQTLTWNSGTNILSIGGGNTVDLTSLKDNTDNQALTWNSGTRQLSLTNGGTVTIADNDTTYSNGNGLSLTGTVFAISAPTCTGTTAKLLWSGTAFTCGTDVDTDTTYTAGSGLSLTGTTFALAQQGATTGQVLKWNGTAWVPAADTDTTYTAGTGISITAGSIAATLGTDITSAEIVDGTITAADLANSGATAGTYGNTGVNVAQLTVNAQGQVTAVSNRALPTATTTTTGVLSSTDWTTFNGKENVLTFSDGLTRTSNTVTLMDCAANQILQRNSGDTAWVCANQVVDTNTTYSAGTGLSLTGTTFANTGVLSVTASGALTSSGGQNPAITLATTSDLTQLGSQLGLTNTGVTPGTYNNVTVDAKGRVTSATNVSYLTSEADAVVGNEVAGVVTNGGLVMTGAGTAGDPYKVGLVTTCADGQLLKYTAIGGWACATDIDTNTDAQTLTWNSGTNILSIGGGNTVDLTSLKDNTDNQALTWNSGTRQLSLTNGGTVTIADNDTTYSNGNGLSLTGTVFAISAPTCTGTTAKLLWSGTAFTCGTDVDTDTTYTAGSGLSLTGTTFALAQQGATTGQVLKWNGTAWVPAADTDTTYTAGTGISITAGSISATLGTDITSAEIVDGTITAADLANSGATAGTYGNTGVNVAQLTVNAQGQVTAVSNRALPTATTTTTGVLSSTDWTTFNGKENVLTFSDGLTRTSNTVTLMDCAANQILQRNSGDTAWVCANQVVDTNTTYSAGTGLSLTGTTFANTGVLSVTASGALTSSGGQNPAITLATTSDLTQLGSQLGLTNTGVTPGTYNNVTVDAKGRVTSATNVSYLTSEADAVVGNEVAGVVTNGGLVMTGAGTAGDPYKVGLVTTCADGQLLKYTAIGGWACATDIDTNTDAQTLTWNSGTNILSIGGGNTVDLTSLKDNTDNQALTWNSGTRQLSLTNGGTVTIADNDTTYSNGNGLSLTGTVFAISAPTCTGTTAKLLWSGTAFTCGTDVDTDTTYTAGSGLSLTGTTFALAQQGATTGQVLKWNGTAWVPAADTDTTYTAGTGISITAGSISATLGTDITSAEIVDGTITAADLANSGATAGTYGNTGVNVAQLTVNAQGQVTAVSNRALPTATTTTTGVLSSTDWTTFNGKENVLTFTGNGLFSRTGNTITGATCTTVGNVLKWNGTAFACATDVDTNTTYTASNGITLTGTNFTLTNDFGASIDSSEITDGTIANADLASSSVSSANIIDGTVATADIANGAITTGKLASCSTNGQILKYYATDPDGAGPLTIGWNCDVDVDTNTDAVSSVFGRTGAVTAQNGDYTAGQVTNTPSGTIAATTVQAALNELDSEKLAVTLNNGQIWVGNGSNVATAVTPSGDVAISNTGVTTIQANSVALGTDTTGNYVAGATSGNGITVSGTAGEGWSPTIAINAPTCTANQYLTWSGSAFSCGTPIDTNTTGVAAGTYGSTTTVPQITVDAAGKITAITNQSIAFPAEVDGVIGNEVTDATANGGLARSGSGTAGSPYTLGLLTTCTDQQLLKWTAGTTSWGCSADSGLTSAVTSLNSLNGGLTLAAGTTGTDFNVSTAGSTITYNLPDASTTARGAVTTGTQTFGGAKTFNVGATAIGFRVTDGTLPHFSIDTTNKLVQIGSSTTDANAIELILDSYNVATDPAGTNGALYYNSNLGKFRCYENGAWADCLSSSVYPQLLVDANRATAQALTTAAAVLPFTAAPTNIGTAYNTTTGIFTAPAAGTYEFVVNVTVSMPATRTSARGEYYIDLYDNTGAVQLQQTWTGDSNDTAGTGFNASAHITRKVVLTSGQQVSVRIAATSVASAKSTLASAIANTLQITRIR